MNLKDRIPSCLKLTAIELLNKIGIWEIVQIAKHFRNFQYLKN